MVSGTSQAVVVPVDQNLLTFLGLQKLNAADRLTRVGHHGFQSCVRQVQQKGDQVRAGKKVRLIHKAPEGEVAAAGARQGKAPALALSQSNRFVNKPAHSLSSGLQKLKLLTLFAEHFHVEVAVSFDPVLVDFNGERSNESQSALLIGEDANDMSAAFDLLIETLKHIGAFEMLVVFSRQPIKGQSFLDVFFHPRTEPRIFFLPAQQPSC